jgi:Zn-finger nucleic acid-binding protein
MRYKGIEIDKCSACRGIWLDGGELERMLTEEQGFLQSLKRIFA